MDGRKEGRTDGRTDRRTDDEQSDPYVSLCFAKLGVASSIPTLTSFYFFVLFFCPFLYLAVNNNVAIFWIHDTLCKNHRKRK